METNENIQFGTCNTCNEPIHYRYPCRCKRTEKNRKIMTICGSTKFKKEFEEINKKYTMMGYIVISVGVFGHSEGITFTDQEKEMLDHIHFQKIDMADEVFIINVGGYVGSSTKKEIAYAQQQNKTIHYLVNLSF